MESIEGTVIDITQEGKGVVKASERVYFVPDTVPGDEVRIQPRKKRRKVFPADLQEVLQASEHRVVPLCAHFEHCGGCKWQHMEYAAQLQYKQKWAVDALERIGKVRLPEVTPILSCEAPFGYRNKMDYSFAAKRWLSKAEIDSGTAFDQHGALGFHVPKVFEKVVQIDHCHLQPEPGNRIRNFVHDRAQQLRIPYYDPKAHEGILRNLLIRTASTGQTMVMLAIYDLTGPVQQLLTDLQQAFPDLTSLGYFINQKKNDSYHDLTPVMVFGQHTIQEQLGKYRFNISAKSFFQTNTGQAEQLYQLVYDLMPEKSALVYDLYCGAGSIGIFVSDKAETVVGVEYVEEAILDARENVSLNGLSGFDFTAGDLAKVLTPDFTAEKGKPEVVICDPPRAGMDAKVVKALLELAAPTIIYVSCNPATQARDLALMEEQYAIDFVQPVDMFPQTSHVENVVRLKRR